MRDRDRDDVGAVARRGPGDLPGGDPDASSLVTHEEELQVGTREVEVGAVRARKQVETRTVQEDVPRRIEHFGDVERVAPDERDSGEVETLPDGSISIPILEEELVITKRTVVRERVVLRKEIAVEQQRVEAELRREHVVVEGDDAVDPLDDAAR